MTRNPNLMKFPWMIPSKWITLNYSAEIHENYLVNYCWFCSCCLLGSWDFFFMAWENLETTVRNTLNQKHICCILCTVVTTMVILKTAPIDLFCCWWWPWGPRCSKQSWGPCLTLKRDLWTWHVVVCCYGCTYHLSQSTWNTELICSVLKVVWLWGKQWCACSCHV